MHREQERDGETQHRFERAHEAPHCGDEAHGLAKARDFHARVPFGRPGRIACGLKMAGDKEHQRPRHQERDEAGDPEQAEGGRRPKQAEPHLVADQRHRDPEQDGDKYGDPDHLDAPPMNPGEERRGPGEQRG